MTKLTKRTIDATEAQPREFFLWDEGRVGLIDNDTSVRPNAARCRRCKAATAVPVPPAASDSFRVSFLVAAAISSIETPARSPAKVKT